MKLASMFPGNKNYIIIADSFFSSIPLIVKLNERGSHYVGSRLPSCNLPDEKDFKRNVEGSYDYRVERAHSVVAIKL